MTVVLLTHWLACIFYLAADLQGEGPDTWVGQAGLGSASRSVRGRSWLLT
jgi:hypothetical protein